MIDYMLDICMYYFFHVSMQLLQSLPSNSTATNLDQAIVTFKLTVFLMLFLLNRVYMCPCRLSSNIELFFFVKSHSCLLHFYYYTYYAQPQMSSILQRNQDLSPFRFFAQAYPAGQKVLASTSHFFSSFRLNYTHLKSNFI